ncbi:DUF4352 domain-containing protein [Cellulosimicrobium cellulans]|uniref:DUF4352 domain-containing protein n=1 Tax=Cellulosimicrobium cellulans TaxID=1710 RepID=UPI00209816ED|nr:DUF4352 domain-containing protein [Cellulosimicrobium cellulans]MCO7274845.1 DUF4352 domain-containing protein [Cellulosimicrobium cellulans]
MSAPNGGTFPQQPAQHPAQQGPTAPAGQPSSSPLQGAVSGHASATPYPGQAGYPGQPPYPGQPGQPHLGAQPPVGPTPPRKNWFARHKVLTGVGVVVLLAVVGASLGGGGGDEPSTPAAVAGTDGADGAVQPETADEAPEAESIPEEPAAEEPAPAAPGVGTAVRDGKFEFTVTSVETGVATVGDEYLNAQAQGQFVLVHMTVTNIGDRAQMFDGSSQKLVDTAGREHSADSSAAIYLGDANSFLTDINPGNSVEGTVVFDVPADAVPATITLHDSFLSGGVEVSLA